MDSGHLWLSECMSEIVPATSIFFRGFTYANYY